ncbi:MAG: AIPR family protein [Halobacteriovoraceae bacterium]|nr:AIPR family protein [Halobacteriovoraceae bacterium]
MEVDKQKIFFDEVIIQEIKKFEVEGRSRSASFLMWFLENFFELDTDNAISAVCDNTNDKGIDGLWVNDDSGEIYIFQSFLPKSAGKGTGDSKLKEFMGVKEWFKNEETVQKLINSSANSDLKNILQENDVDKKIASGDYKVMYVFVTATEPDYNSDEFNTVSDVEIFDLKKMSLRHLYIAKEGGVKGKKSLLVINGFTFDLADEEKMSGLYLISAVEILKLDGVSDGSIFSKNVRLSLRRSRINQAIEDTISAEPSNFPVYNNGITIVCDRFIQKDNNIELENYAIVNGCQTTTTLYNSENLENVAVVVKIIQTNNDNNLERNITVNSNNQNAISLSDLKSDDITQKRISKEFQELSSKYSLNIFYKNKRGGEDLQPDNFSILQKDHAAQLLMSAVLGESYNSHLKTKIYSDLYKDIFNKDTTAFRIFLLDLIYKEIDNQKIKIKDQRIANYGLARLFIISLVFKVLKDSSVWKEFFINQSKETFFRNQDSFRKWISKIVTMVINIFNAEILREKELNQGEIDYKNVFKNREKCNELSTRIVPNFQNALIALDKNIDSLYTN